MPEYVPRVIGYPCTGTVKTNAAATASTIMIMTILALFPPILNKPVFENGISLIMMMQDYLNVSLFELLEQISERVRGVSIRTPNFAI